MGMSFQGVLGLVATIIGAVFIAIPRLTGSHNVNTGLGLGIGVLGPVCLAAAPRKLGSGHFRVRRCLLDSVRFESLILRTVHASIQLLRDTSGR